MAQAAAGATAGPSISFVIKTLNEEAKIARCLESVLEAAAELAQSFEIIVADSLSTDRTVEIARRYPVIVVQMQHLRDRGCGAGVQLGYQHSRGERVFLLDGDMELCTGFLPQAMARLDENPRLAGVAGVLVDTAIRNTFDRYRVVNAVSSQARREKSLGGGGLYRREAIAACGGYAADRNLKGWEEAELGMRLAAGGWELERIGVPSVRHTGHSAGTVAVLRSLWRSRRAMASGVLLRQAFRHPWWRGALQMMIQPVLVLAMWVVLLACLAGALATGAWWLPAAALAVVLLALAAFALRKRSLAHAATSFALWHFHAASIVVGLFEPVVPPTRPIDSVRLPGAGAA